MSGTNVTVQVDERTLTLSNLDKVLYPATGLTKAGIVDYYARIAPVMLPHLHGRPLTLVRYPNGVDAPSFFEKRRPPHAPDWIPSGGELGSVLCQEPAALVWLANLAALELHTHQHRDDARDLPTAVVLDLDPGPPATVLDCAACRARRAVAPRTARAQRRDQDIGIEGICTSRSRSRSAAPTTTPPRSSRSRSATSSPRPRPTASPP